MPDVVAIYGNKLDHSVAALHRQSSLPAGGWGGALRDAYATNWGVTPNDVSWLAITDQSVIDRAGNHDPYVIAWSDPGPTGEVTGLDFTVDDGIKFGLRAVRTGGKAPDANDGIIYLAIGESVTLVLEVWHLVDGVPSVKIEGNPSGHPPTTVDRQREQRVRAAFTSGTSQTWTFSHHDGSKWWGGEIRVPTEKYVNSLYKTFGPSLIIRNSLSPSET